MKLITVVLPVLTAFSGPSSAQEKPAPVAQQGATLTAERRELAEIQLLLTADRKYAEAKERLAALKTTLAARTDTEAKDLLASVGTLESTVRRALGEAVPASLTNAGQDKVDEAVLAAIQREDFEFVRQLGKHATPGLVQAVRANVESFPSDREKDPLWHLARIDPPAASQLAGELLGESGYLWKARVTRIFEAISSQQSAPQRWVPDGLQQTAEKYAEDPEVGVPAMRFLIQLASKGARSPRFDELLGRWLRSADADRRAKIGQIASSSAAQLGAAVFEPLLADGDDEVRAYGADVLVGRFSDSRAILEHASDPSPRVRRSVVQWLDRSAASLQARERETLVALLWDTDAEVSDAAWKVLWRFPAVRHEMRLPSEEAFGLGGQTRSRDVFQEPLADSVYRKLLTEGPANRRADLAGLATKLPSPLCFELLEALAKGSDPAVLNRVLSSLQYIPAEEDAEASMRIAAALLDNPASIDRNPLYLRIERTIGSRATLRAMVRWAVAREDDELVRAMLVDNPSFSVQNLVVLEPELVARCAARIFELSRDRKVFARWQAWTPAHSQAFLALARDGSRSVGLRSLALLAVAVNGGVDRDFAALARAVAVAPGWNATDELAGASDTLMRLLRLNDGALANALILELLCSETSPEPLVIQATSLLEPSLDGAAEIVPLVVQRGWGKEPWSEAVKVAIRAMGEAPALQSFDVLSRAAREADTYGYVALHAIAQTRDPRYIPVLAALVEQPAAPWQLGAAAQALCVYLDADAVEPLLAAAAKVSDAEVRDACLAHLEKIREYLDAKQRWAASKVKAQTREQVIAELVAQLGAKSDDVKVQAIRALATWEALETMPKLIELTTSGSKSVAAAAREALDQLNTPKKD